MLVTVSPASVAVPEVVVEMLVVPPTDVVVVSVVGAVVTMVDVDSLVLKSW